MAVTTGGIALSRIIKIRQQRNNLHKKILEINETTDLSPDKKLGYIKTLQDEAISLLKRHKINEEHYKILTDRINEI